MATLAEERSIFQGNIAGCTDPCDKNCIRKDPKLKWKFKLQTKEGCGYYIKQED